MLDGILTIGGVENRRPGPTDGCLGAADATLLAYFRRGSGPVPGAHTPAHTPAQLLPTISVC